MRKRGIIPTTFILLLSLLLLSSELSCSVFDPQKIKREVLENGLVVITRKLPSNPVVTVDIWVKAGSINENDRNSGISHFLEHMLFKGSKKRGSGEIDKAIESIGGKINGGTSMDFTHYYATVPSQYLDLALDVMIDMVLNPVFDPQELEKERLVVLEEIRRKQDIPEDYLREVFRSQIYQFHPYKRPVLGTEETLRKISREDLIDYHQKYYVPNNMSIILVGNFEREIALQKIKDEFKEVKFKKVPAFPSIVEPPPPSLRKLIEEKDVNQAYLMIGFPAPSVKDRPEVYAMDLILTLLGEGRSSRLYQNLKEKKQLVTEIGVDFLTQRDPGIFTITAILSPDKLQEVIKEILNEVNLLKTELVSEKELAKTKVLLENMVALDTETSSGQSSFFGFYETIDTMEFALTYIDEVKKITPDQIRVTANKYFDEKRYTLVVIKPKKSKD